MADQKKEVLTIPCGACGNLTPARGPLADDRLQIESLRCGYAFNLSLKCLKEAHGGKGYSDGAVWI